MATLYAFAAPVEAGGLPGELERVAFLATGIGKAACAQALTRRLADALPDRVVLFGVCGAYRDLAVGDLCLVSGDVLADEGVATPDGFLDLAALGLPAATRLPMDARHTAVAAARLGQPRVVAAATVSTCAGTDALAAERAARTGAVIETMEGAAAALACAGFGVPLVQVRAVSNRTGDRARAGFDLPGACARVQAAVRALVAGGWR